MGKETGIAWTDHTFNAWWGCTRVSPGCEHCYAEAWAKRTGYAKGGAHLPVWGVDAERRAMSDKYWAAPLAWNRSATIAGVRRRVFCSSMADVFESVHPRNTQAFKVQAEARARLWTLIAATPRLDWQLLTKRPENVAQLVPWGDEWPRNVWIGCTAEDQQRADDRLPHLLALPAAVRFVSYEPALGPVYFGPWLPDPMLRSRTTSAWGAARAIDWLIVGGESGPKARPFALEWAERALSACAHAGVPAFMKQLGDYVVSEGRTAAYDPDIHHGPESDYAAHLAPNGEVWAWRMGNLSQKGSDPATWPARLRVQHFPGVDG